MTIEEAAATLGLVPSQVAPELVERNYRLKVKHCHPDRASYPGATADFKRTTEAFNRLREPTDWPTRSASRKPNPEVVRAAETFVFAATYCLVETWNPLNWTERLGHLAGTCKLRLQQAGHVTTGTPLAEFVDETVDASCHPLLIAPVDSEVLGFETRYLCRTWVLRPTETREIRSRLERSLAEGRELKSAIEKLQRELLQASRLRL